MQKMLMTLLVSMILLPSHAITICSEELESLPIQQNGRAKPLLVHARENIKYLTGSYKFNGKSSVTTYCELSTGTLTDLTAKIEHVDLMKLLNIGEEHYVTYSKLLSMQNLLRSNFASLPKHSSFQKSIDSLLEKIEIYKNITTGNDWLIPEISNGATNWSTYSQLIASKEQLTPEKFSTIKNDYIKFFGDNYLSELTYTKLYLSHWALMFVILALFSSVLLKKLHVALSFSTLAIAAQTAILVFRTIISERAPITNMYESVLFSGYGGLILAMILGHLKKDKILLIVGLSYNVCTLFMINFANNMLPSSIGPLVPVLRDNFWLSTHVTTIIISYGALALSWVLANIVLIKKRYLGLGDKDDRYYSDLIYLCLKYGTVFLAAGIILGGVWADYSWGRFWGWDPKETWSLIVLCIYMAIIHGKYSSWIRPDLFIPLTAGAFMSVMMAWFGVNYILASGLHSYGFSQGGTIFIGAFFILQIITLAITFQKKN